MCGIEGNMRGFISTLAAVLMAAASAHAQSAGEGAPKPDDLLTLAKGAVLISATVDPGRAHSLRA